MPPIHAKPPLRPEAPHPIGAASTILTSCLNFSLISKAAFKPVYPPPITNMSVFKLLLREFDFFGLSIV